MTSDKEKRSAETQEPQPSDTLPQRDLPMPAYEFQTPSQSSGGLHPSSEGEPADRSPQERASLRNFSVRTPAFD
jgi:hypothetical protein